METYLRHAGNARWQRDEGANDRKQAANKDSDGAITSQRTAVVRSEIARTQQNIAAKTFDEGTTAVSADPIGDDRPKVAADSASRRKHR